MTADTKIVYLKPCELAVISTVGPYSSSEQSAWTQLFEWLDRGQHHEPNGMGFGLSYDMTADDQECIKKYTAGVRVPRSWRQTDWESMQIHTFGGGAYMMHKNVATYDYMSGLISEIEKQWIPRSGLYFDRSRPVLSLYRHDPRVTSDEQQKADVCLPVHSERRCDVRMT